MLKPIQTLSKNYGQIPKEEIKTSDELHPGLDAILRGEISTILTDYFKQGIHIKSYTVLSEAKRRNRIIRAHIEGSSKSTPKHIIFKQTLKEDQTESDQDSLRRFSRDWAGLEFLSNINFQFSPHFYGGSLKHRFVLLEDLGELHVSLVDSLTSDKLQDAKAALHRLVKSMGQFHAAGYEKTQEYFKILHQLNPNLDTWQNDLDRSLEKSVPQLQSLLKKLNISASEELWKDIKSVLKSNIGPGPFTTLIHGDICPDNVFDNPLNGEMHFIDFEHASVRSALLDGTYLRMGMPTCWCAKAIPNNLILELENIYREELKKKIPATHDDKVYHTAYVNACAFWMLNKGILLIEDVLDEERVGGSGPTPPNSLWKREENLVRPRVISRLQAFIDVTIKYNQLSTLRDMAEKILDEVKLQWPDVLSLNVYPAFEKSHGREKGNPCN